MNGQKTKKLNLNCTNKSHSLQAVKKILFIFPLVFILSLLIVNAVSLSDVAGQYRFEEGSGTTAIDSSGHENDGTHSATYINSKSTNGSGSFALNFSRNIADEVTLSNEAEFDYEFTDNFSVTALINFSELGAPPQDIIGKIDSATEKGWTIRLLGNGKIEVIFQKSQAPFKRFEVDSTTALTANTWNCIGFTYNGTQLADAASIFIYINGQPEVNIIVANDPLDTILNNVNVQIGADGSGINKFGGAIDEVNIINKTLTAQEMLDVCNQGLIDNTPPVITLIAPTNNTRNNTHPLDITFSVTDDSPNLIICNLNNNTNTFDSGTFFQAVTSTLTLDTGLTEINQEFPNLNLVCFDNSPANNSATLLLNITLDNILPVITVISPLDLSSFNSEIISSINVKGDCEDAPVFRYNITITNASDTVFAKGSEIIVSNVISIDETFSLSGLGAGNYTVTHTCSDPHTKQNIPDYILKKNTSTSKLIWLTPSGNEIQLKYSTPPKNPVSVLTYSTTKSPDNSKYTFYYKLNATEDGTEYTWNFELENNKNQVQYISDSPFAGHFVMENNFLDMEFKDNENATYSIYLNNNNNYEIEITTTKTELNFTSVGELNTEIVITTFEVLIIEQVEDLFKVTECRTDTGSVILLALFFFISFFFIYIGLTQNIGFIGFFGAILMMILSWFIAACIAIFAMLMALLSLVLIIFFVIRFIGFKNAPYQP